MSLLTLCLVFYRYDYYYCHFADNNNSTKCSGNHHNSNYTEPPTDGYAGTVEKITMHLVIVHSSQRL